MSAWMLPLILALSAAPPRIDTDSLQIILPDADVILGETEFVDLDIVAAGGQSATAGTTPELFCSTGVISAATPVGPGKWRARYTPPAARYPHVVLLSAQVFNDAGPAVTTAAIPLFGQGQLVVATQPESEVVVYIGELRYGPAIADAQGNATVSIQVPPGPEHAIAESIDPAGNQTTKSVPLNVPPFNRLAAVALDKVAVADGTGTAQLLVFVVDKKGSPRFALDDLVTSASVGTVDAIPVGLGPGLFRVLYRPGAIADQEAKIAFSLRGDEASKGEVTLRLLSGAPQQAALKLSRSVFTPDDARPITVTASWTDAAGNPSDVDAARLIVDHGRLESFRTTGPGAVTAQWRLPVAVSKSAAKLSVRTTTGNALAAAVVTIAAGRPTLLLLDEVAPIVANGRDGAEIRVRAQDRAGNLVLPAGVQLSSTGGQIVAQDTEDKSVRASFVPEAVTGDDEARVSAVLGDLRADRIVVLKSPPRPVLTVALHLRADWNYGRFISGGPQASFLLRIPRLLDDSLHVGVNLAYLPSIPFSVPADDGLTLGRWHQAFPATFQMAWRPVVYGDIMVHVGAGAGATIGDLSLFRDDAGAGQRVVYVALGGEVSLGAAYRLGPGEIEANLHAGYYYALSPKVFGTPTGLGMQFGYRVGF